MHARVIDRLGQRLHRMVSTDERPECANCLKCRDMLRPNPLEDDRDPPALKIVDDLLERVRPACVQHSDAPEPQDDNADVSDIDELIEEAL